MGGITEINLENLGPMMRKSPLYTTPFKVTEKKVQAKICSCEYPICEMLDEGCKVKSK